jgi:glutathione peroxidase-family protein
MATLHDFTMQSITGEEIALARFAGRLSLVVNVASR